MMIVLGDSRIQAGVQPLKSHVKPSFLNACEMTERVCGRESLPCGRSGEKERRTVSFADACIICERGVSEGEGAKGGTTHSRFDHVKGRTYCCCYSPLRSRYASATPCVLP